MKRIKTFGQLFESEANGHQRVYEYLRECLAPGTYNGSPVFGIHPFVNYDDPNGIINYKTNGVKRIDIAMNTYMLKDSVSYAFTQALNPNPTKNINGVYPGMDYGNMTQRLKFNIINLDDDAKFIGTSDNIDDWEIGGSDDFIFKFIIEQTMLDFSKYDNKFLFLYGLDPAKSVDFTPYIESMSKYFNYLLKLNVGDPIKYDIMEDIDGYFKKNPLDLYKIDDMPSFKADVLRRTGIKDYSAIGRKLKSGMI
jgi:hypothetical protein